MLKQFAVVLTLIAFLLVCAFGQQRRPQNPATPSPQASPASTPSDDDDVVRITTNLVQVDAIVTDKNGRQVTNLNAEDFQILENGKPQPITHFAYITTEPPNSTSSIVASPSSVKPGKMSKADRNALPPAPRLRPEEVGRTIAIVVDDLGMSAEAVGNVRNAVRRYVDEQVQPGDVVAIIRTSAGVGALQQFTNDRRVLYAAMAQVRWLPISGKLTAIRPIDPLDRAAGADLTGDTFSPDALPESVDSQRTSLKEINELRQEYFTVGTLGAINAVVQGLREMPGRKAVILFSEGMSLQDSRGEGTMYQKALQRLIDAANRAAVIFYTVDAKGLAVFSLTAADNTAGAPPGAGGSVRSIRPDEVGKLILGPRASQVFTGQAGLSFLARETGGLALINNNDLNFGIRRALDDLRGYYLIGYRPDESTFQSTTGQRRFNKLSLKLKNPRGLQVRTRTGFLGVSDNQERPKPRTRSEQLMAGLVSPFAAAGVDLRLTSIFADVPGAGSVVRSLLLIDPRNLTFTQQEDGHYQAVMDLLAVTIGQKFEVIDELNRIETIRVRPEVFQRFMQEGMVYELNVPIRNPGAYQLRIAVRDAATERLGSASQYVSVPDLRDKRLALSGLVLASSPTSSLTSNTEPTGVSLADPAARRFHRGKSVDYGFFVYNARPEPNTGIPRLTIQSRLLRDGKVVFSSQPRSFDPGRPADPQRIEASGQLQLGSQLTAGHYVLQIIVTDELADKRHRVASQWIEFELLDQMTKSPAR